MKKILLISDTHGRMDAINNLAETSGADCCFHLGDLCMYTKESVQRLPKDMLIKQLEHSPRINAKELASLDSKDIDSIRRMALEYQTYGNFENFLMGRKRFNIPVFAIPGNNEDPYVYAMESSHNIPNLTFLDNGLQVVLEQFLVCGIGGETQPQEFGYETTQQQREELCQLIKSHHSELVRILLTHIPPYENEKILWLTNKLSPMLHFCGHTHHWDERLMCGCHVTTLPSSERGYAILELQGGNYNYTAYHIKD